MYIYIYIYSIQVCLPKFQLLAVGAYHKCQCLVCIKASMGKSQFPADFD